MKGHVYAKKDVSFRDVTSNDNQPKLCYELSQWLRHHKCRVKGGIVRLPTSHVILVGKDAMGWHHSCLDETVKYARQNCYVEYAEDWGKVERIVTEILFDWGYAVSRFIKHDKEYGTPLPLKKKFSAKVKQDRLRWRPLLLGDPKCRLRDNIVRLPTGETIIVCSDSTCRGVARSPRAYDPTTQYALDFRATKNGPLRSLVYRNPHFRALTWKDAANAYQSIEIWQAEGLETSYI